jgi:signal transduction histidine kinase
MGVPRPEQEPAAAFPVELEKSAPAAGEVDAQALSDVVHEIRNYFHRLYHWFDMLRDQPLRPEGREALEGAGATLTALDGFINGAFDLFRPIELSFIRMSASDLVDSVALVVRRHAGGVPVTVEVRGTLANIEIALDPGRMSGLIEGLLARLLGRTGDGRLRLGAEVTHGERPLLTLRLELEAVTGGGDPVLRVADVEWAAMERIVLQHGGKIALEAGAGGHRRAVIVLPAGAGAR